MISIISIADGVLRDRAAAFKLVKGRLYVIGAHRSYDATLYTEVDADSSAFEIGAASWNGSAWQAYPAPKPDTSAADGYRASLLRKARKLERMGDITGALNERLKILTGE
ncbi:MAG: hypothetical protein NUV75_01980 [Gallionella sp.]|nr:hypothetical protein [Gallionella sp.]